MIPRAGGVLLHVTSLPAAFGIGDMGKGAYAFADFLAQAKQSFWQILPLNPTSFINGNSPYSSNSAFAGNVLLISPELLKEEGLLEEGDLADVPDFDARRVDYPRAAEFKLKILARACARFERRADKSRFKTFCAKEDYWLDDFALFVCLKAHFQGKIWSEWPGPARDREPNALREFKAQLAREIEKEKFFQFLFFEQWNALKDYCRAGNISLFGDIPIYVTYDSADVWANSGLFKLDKDRKMTHAAGVPPDYFSKTGQLWGNPIYRWKVMQDNGFSWWIKRIAHNLELFDYVRIDHFRGFAGFWQVPAGEKTAVNGTWEKAPAKKFFETLRGRFPRLPIIAEDLGIITDDVKELMRHFEFPGMKVLLFAFGEDLPAHPYLPHNFIRNCVVYTGTHDNNTARGWFEKEARADEKKRLFEYIGRELSAEDIAGELIRLAMMSVADLAIFPMQDFLGLGREDRMNLPGTLDGNWQWRVSAGDLTARLAGKIALMSTLFARAGKQA